MTAPTKPKERIPSGNLFKSFDEPAEYGLRTTPTIQQLLRQDNMRITV